MKEGIIKTIITIIIIIVILRIFSAIYISKRQKQILKEINNTTQTQNIKAY